LRENENVLLIVAEIFGAMDKPSLDDSRENFPENEISRVFVKIEAFSQNIAFAWK
jgi:hypothetical protein